MRQRLGDASTLVDDDMFLPMFRNRQIQYPELFAYSVKLAKKKKQSSRYFAAIWACKNLKKTLDWLQKLINLSKNKAVEVLHAIKKHQEARKIEENTNSDGMNRYIAMRNRLLDSIRT